MNEEDNEIGAPVSEKAIAFMFGILITELAIIVALVAFALWII